MAEKKKASSKKQSKKNTLVTKKEIRALNKAKGVPFGEEDEKTGNYYLVYQDGTKVQTSKGNKGVKYLNVDLVAAQKNKPSFKPSKVRRMQNYKPIKGIAKSAKQGFLNNYYHMTAEVAGQGAETKKEKQTKNLARKDMQYIEAKYPKTYKRNEYYDKKKKSTTKKSSKKK
jgi:hypothetical protein